MLKSVFAATAAVTIASSTMAYAQRDERGDGARRWQPTTEDIRAFQAARLAALRAGLSLTLEQEKNWPAFEQAMRELQQLRLNRITAMREARRGREGQPQATDPAERMRERATRLSESGAVLKRLAEATDPLYRSLDDAQKRRFAILTRANGPRGWQGRGRDGQERGMPRGYRRTDAAPEGDIQVFSRKTVSGDVFAQAFVAKSVDGVMVGRVFGAKSVNGDLVVGEVVTFGGRLAAASSGTFGAKLIANEGATFSRKITIGEPSPFGRKAMTSI